MGGQGRGHARFQDKHLAYIIGLAGETVKKGPQSLVQKISTAPRRNGNKPNLWVGADKEEVRSTEPYRKRNDTKERHETKSEIGRPQNANPARVQLVVLSDRSTHETRGSPEALPWVQPRKEGKSSNRPKERGINSLLG